MECIKCTALFEPSEAGAPTPSQIVAVVLKDWRLWVLSVVVTVAAGVTAGSLNLPTTWFMSGAGAAVAFYVAVRLATVKKCPKCGAVFQSGSLRGRKSTP